MVCRRLKLRAAYLVVLLWVRACKRAYAPGGAGYGQAQSRFEQRQHDEVDLPFFEQRELLVLHLCD